MSAFTYAMIIIAVVLAIVLGGYAIGMVLAAYGDGE